MADTVFRVHPAIGIGRVGDSEEFYIAPVTAAGTIGPSGLMGGLPIKPGTEDTPITAEDFRDKDGNVKRQAARFRVYAYPAGSSGKYPSGGGTLVTVGSVVDGKKVVDIVWTVHLANKKLNNYSTVSQGGQFRGSQRMKNPVCSNCATTATRARPTRTIRCACANCSSIRARAPSRLPPAHRP